MRSGVFFVLSPMIDDVTLRNIPQHQRMRSPPGSLHPGARLAPKQVQTCLELFRPAQSGILHSSQGHCAGAQQAWSRIQLVDLRMPDES